MNKRILALAKKNLKEKYIYFFKNTNMPGLPKNYILRLLVLLASYIVMIVFSFMISMALVSLMNNNIIKEADYFTYSAILVTIVILAFSTYQVISDFYNAKDTEILLSFPFKNDEIFLGKFLGNVFGEMDYFIFFAAIMIVYAVKSSFDIGKILMGILAFISLIVTAYCALCLLIMIIMRFTNARKHKTLFKFIGYGLLLVILGLYYYFIFSAKDINIDDKQIDEIVERLKQFKIIIERIFYPSTLFGRAIGNKDYLAFLALLAIGCISFLIVKFVASKIYLDSIIEKNGAKSKKKNKNLKVSHKSSSQTIAIARKELYSVIKNPVYLYQSAIIVVMMSAIILSTGKNLNLEETIRGLDPSMRKELPAIFLAAGLLIASFLFSNATTAFNSLSREGKSFYLIQTLPIDPNANFLGRFLGLYFIDFIVGTIMSLVLIIIMKLSLIQGLAFYLGMSIGSVFAIFYSLYWGTKRIYTSWTKPAEINKTGLTGLLMFILSMIINTVIYGLAFGIYWLSNSISLALMEVIVGLTIGSVLFYLLGLEKYKNGFFDVK
ncbi:MAG: hypothetical protein PUG67_06025 [Peptoniphilaceae bacterium]|nr:hypothetical protein [Peptoniphilaceae bacterium]MDY6018059.1 hypothetical protein [Anaerococcus sp.]